MTAIRLAETAIALIATGIGCLIASALTARHQHRKGDQ